MRGVNTLLEVGGSIDIRDKAQRTLLHRASEEVINHSRCPVSPFLEKESPRMMLVAAFPGRKSWSKGQLGIQM